MATDERILIAFPAKEPKLRMNSHERSSLGESTTIEGPSSVQIYLHIFYRTGYYSTNSLGSGFTRVGRMHEVLEG